MKKIVVLVIVVVSTGIGVIWFIGGKLSSPVHVKVGISPSDLESENVVFENVHGWYFPAPKTKTCLLLMHGVRSNRNQMVSRARFLVKAGYPSFAIDLQAHGETPGTEITFGYRESVSARSAVKFLREENNCEKVVALGSSLGGAASLLGKNPIHVDGYILEAVYPSIELAVENRLRVRFGKIGELLAPLIYFQIPYRLGIDLKDLQPVSAIKKIKSPIVIMNGSEDQRTTLKDARRLYDNAPDQKVFIQVNGAAHIDLYEFQAEKYRENVLEFLSEYIDGRT